jgi:uncharacterized membrane protein YedE/YeeE
VESYFYPLLGGVLIGLASSLMLLNLGRMTGISGIFYSTIFEKQSSSNYWRYSFIIGLVLGGGIVNLISPELFQYEFESSFLLIVVAGIIVGFGTRMGGGCTSGHGVCGLPRKSIRSFIATITFMLTGILTVYLKGLL